MRERRPSRARGPVGDGAGVVGGEPAMSRFAEAWVIEDECALAWVVDGEVGVVDGGRDAVEIAHLAAAVLDRPRLPTRAPARRPIVRDVVPRHAAATRAFGGGNIPHACAYLLVLSSPSTLQSQSAICRPHHAACCVPLPTHCTHTHTNANAEMTPPDTDAHATDMARDH
uniref:Uncharacterized protein n=1 Tax=Oryza nivara TaxID=4536 RepID=A0A0E0HP73_ORYNI